MVGRNARRGLAVAALVAMATTAGANDWVNPFGGAFHDPANWDAAGVPGPGVPARFDLNAAYVVWLEDDVFARIVVLDDAVTLDLQAHQVGAPIGVALDPGTRGALTLLNGTVDVGPAQIFPAAPDASGTLMLDRVALQSGASNFQMGASNEANVYVVNGAALQHQGTTFQLGADPAGRGTLAVDGDGSLVRTTATLVVGDGGHGTVSVTGGGGLETRQQIAVIGKGLVQAPGHGSVLIEGPGSEWLAGPVDVGGIGSGGVLVAAGGRVDSAGVNVGVAPGSSGVLVVEGIGSRWDVGTQSPAHLAIGGTTSVPGGAAQVTIVDLARVTVNGDVLVHHGSALTIAGGASLSSVRGLFGQMTGAAQGPDTQAAPGLVEGPGSRWTVAADLAVGVHAPGSLVVRGGASIDVVTVLDIGRNGSSAGSSMVIGGAGTTVSAQRVTVGGTSTQPGGQNSSLTVADGARLTMTDPLIVQPGSKLLVPGGVVSLPQDNAQFAPGSTVAISGGGSLAAGGITIGTGQFGPMPRAAVTVDGHGSLLSGLQMMIGDQSPASLTVTGGARVSTAATVSVARAATGAQSALVVRGAGTTMQIGSTTAQLLIGGQGTSVGGQASVDVLDLARVGITHAIELHSTSRLTVDGGASVSANGPFHLYGAGNLSLGGGASLNTMEVILGRNSTPPGVRGMATLAGAGTNWTHGGQMIVGDGTGATLLVRDGATLNSFADAFIGATPGAAGSAVEVRGAGANWQLGTVTNAFIRVGGNNNAPGGAASLTIADGGRVSTSGHIRVFQNSRIDVTSGGVLSTTATTALDVDAQGLLHVGDGTVTATLFTNKGHVELAGNAVLNGATVNNEGVLSGNGRVGHALNNAVFGQVRVGAQQSLTFPNPLSSVHNNNGAIQVTGGGIEFARTLFNSTSGLISGRGTFRFGSGMGTGLSNDGTLAVSGDSDVFGDVQNNANGKLIVSGGATATFHDDVVNQAGAQVRISDGSAAVFLGSYAGAGTVGTGTAYLEGDLRPGFSPGTMNFGGSLAIGPAATYRLELGGTQNGQYDRVVVAGNASLAGTLAVTLIDNFTPTLGDRFEVLEAASVVGTFDSVTGGAVGGVELKPIYRNTGVTLLTTGIGEHTWAVDGGGSWTQSTNWAGGTPDAPGAFAALSSSITADAQITLPTDVTVGRLRFDDDDAYTLVGPGTIRLQMNGAPPVIQSSGARGVTEHVIAAPIEVVGAAPALVDLAGGNLTLSGPITNGQNLDVRGTGRLTLIGPKSIGDVRGSAGLIVGDGTTPTDATVASLDFGTVVVSAGASLQVADGPAPTGVVVVDALVLQGDGSVDLGNNDLVVRDGVGAYPSLRQHVLDGRITTTVPDAVLAPVENAMIRQAEWDGVPIGDGIDFGQLLLVVTYPGDVNLDGAVTEADYANLVATMGKENARWIEGDVDLDTLVTAADFQLVTANLGRGTGGAMGEPLTSLAAVPEPAMAALLALPMLLARRRRRPSSPAE